AWVELRQAALAFGLPGEWPAAPPPCRVVKERRATPRHTPGPPLRPRRLSLANLALAGDWTLPALPATIEAAVESGRAAARALLAPRRLMLSVRRHPALPVPPSHLPPRDPGSASDAAGAGTRSLRAAPAGGEDHAG
ncbi:MAG TPA: FAD-dependent oxidoreductase, partial [Crenalkalicoccus sp.]|nr:FAD-dependent oxidoreductase [Crenalkalicoccus sp.]